MSHIRNAHVVNAPISFVSDANIYGCFLFQLFILIHFLHTWTDFDGIHRTRSRELARPTNRKQIKMSKKYERWNKIFVKLYRSFCSIQVALYHFRIEINDLWSRLRGLTIDYRRNWLASQTKYREMNVKIKLHAPFLGVSNRNKYLWYKMKL